MADVIFPKTGQGVAVPADPVALEKDQLGYTHPNLHRRIDPQEPYTFEELYVIEEGLLTDSYNQSQSQLLQQYEAGQLSEDEYNSQVSKNYNEYIQAKAQLEHEIRNSIELAPREYTLGIYGVDSYRTTKVYLHSEELPESESDITDEIP